MLERSGGAMRQHITTENMYEQRLLPEVVSGMTCHSSQAAAIGRTRRLAMTYVLDCLHTVHLHTLLLQKCPCGLLMPCN